MTLDLATQSAEPRGLAVADPEAAAGALAHILGTGDLSKLTNEERVGHYLDVCQSLGLNPRTRPFDWIEFYDPETKGKKLALYANRSCAEQLRRQHQISVRVVRREPVGELFVVEVEGTSPNGRVGTASKYVSVLDRQGQRLRGNQLASAYMKAETGAFRRLTFSMVGMASPPDMDELSRVRIVTVDGRGNVLESPTAEQKALAADPTMARVLREPTYETTANADDSPLAGQPDQRVRPDELERPKREGPPATFRPSKEQIAKWRSEYFGAVSGTSYAEDDGRHDLVEQWTDGRTGSLMTFLGSATERQAAEFIANARDGADIERAERVTEARERPEGISEPGYASILRTGVPGSISDDVDDEGETASDLPARPDPAADYTRPQVLKFWSDWANAMRRMAGSYPFPDVTRLKTPELGHELGQLIRAVEDLHAAGDGSSEESQDSSDDSLAF